MSEEMKQVIHIGANKTGSTLLQRKFFASHPQVSYLGEDCVGYKEISEILHILVHEDDSFYDKQVTSELFQKQQKKNSVKDFIFSCEDIMTTKHPTVTARRLKELMPKAQVVIVLRNQLTVWPSWYVNHGAYLKPAPRRYWRRYISFEEWLEYCFEFPRQTPVEAMNYNRFFDIFSNLFGKSQIKVLLYEDLKLQSEKYLNEWADILNLPRQEVLEYLSGERERTRNSSRRFYFHRLCSSLPDWLQKNIENMLGDWLNRGKPAKVDIPDKWIEQIRDYYGRGNKKISEKAALDLEKYDYPYF